MNCYECGGNVIKIAKHGRVMSYRGRPGFVIPADLEIETCAKCGDHLITMDVAEALDEAFEKQWIERSLP